MLLNCFLSCFLLFLAHVFVLPLYEHNIFDVDLVVFISHLRYTQNSTLMDMNEDSKIDANDVRYSYNKYHRN